MAYRMSPRVSLLHVKDQQGIIWCHWGADSGCRDYRGRNRGPVIPWLSDEQREHFLRLGLVEEIADEESAPADPVTSEDLMPAPNSDLVDECVAALDRFEVPAEAGAPTARKALRAAGEAWGNDTIAAAVRRRKHRALSETVAP